MKKILSVLAIVALAACNDEATSDVKAVDSTGVTAPDSITVAIPDSVTVAIPDSAAASK